MWAPLPKLPVESVPGAHPGACHTQEIDEIRDHLKFLANLLTKKNMCKKLGSTISTLLYIYDKINPKDCQVLSLGDSGFLHFLRVVSIDYGKPVKEERLEHQTKAVKLLQRAVRRLFFWWRERSTTLRVVDECGGNNNKNSSLKTRHVNPYSKQ